MTSESLQQFWAGNGFNLAEQAEFVAIFKSKTP